jgi:hypothetical protein
LKDTLVNPSSTTNFADTQCAAGQHIEYRAYPNATHATIALGAMSEVRAWFRTALTGGALATSCP